MFDRKIVLGIAGGLLVALLMPWQTAAQNIKSGVVNSRDQILGATTIQQKQSQKQFAEDPPAGKGKPGPLPCNSKNNPKCEPDSPSKPGDVKGKGNL